MVLRITIILQVIFLIHFLRLKSGAVPVNVAGPLLDHGYAGAEPVNEVIVFLFDSSLQRIEIGYDCNYVIECSQT